ncbi:MAG: inositol monophosphatase family protein [Eubacterium sp.]|nr:inositol monophosphatase family protein [Eubacterium sp.]
MSRQVTVAEMAEVVREAAKLFGNDEERANVTVKGRFDYVTEVDRNVQAKIAAELLERFPDVQFMGEEKDNEEVDRNGRLWILDPVDGTTNLIHDLRASSVSLAFVEGKTPLAGLVYNPYLDEMYTAEKGKGARLNGRPIHVSRADSLEMSLISVGTAPYYPEHADWTFAAAKNVFLHCQDIRRSGSAAIELAAVAAGRLEGTFEKILQPWDFAAGMLLVEEAGGRFTDFSGNRPDCTMKSEVLASNGLVHEELRAYMNDGRD